MPGIFGIVSRELRPDLERQLQQMSAGMRFETAAPGATLTFPDLRIYAGWIAPPGSFAAVHSSFDVSRDIALIFSGECYQDEHWIEDDTESWIITNYEKFGERCFERLNGLFSGLLIDQRRKRAFLFNDRYGIERIYYHQTHCETYFASEAKALLAVLPELQAFDETGVAQYLAYGCTLEARTLFRGISLLPGGSAWVLESGAVQRKGSYFQPAVWEAQESLTEQQFAAQFSETFKRVLPRYTEDAESVGIALTGGLDTRMIMACLPQTETSHPCYTFVGESGLTLDARLAARIAEGCGLRHHALRIEPDFLRNFGTHLDRTVGVTDGYAGATASHEIYFNARARELSPIRLTGNFGGEVFRSVSTFNPLRLKRALLSDGFAAAVESETRRAGTENIHPVTFAAFREIPWNLFGLLAAGRSQMTFRTPYLDNDLVALAYRAPGAERPSPLPALHLIRSANPQLATIPTDRGELLGGSTLGRVFRRTIGEVTFKLDYLHKEGLPTFLSAFDPLLNGVSLLGVPGLHKFLPYRRWFRKELASTIMERVSSERVRQAPWWSRNSPERVARAHISGRTNNVREINTVLTLEAVDRLFFKQIIPATSAELESALRVTI